MVHPPAGMGSPVKNFLFPLEVLILKRASRMAPQAAKMKQTAKPYRIRRIFRDTDQA